MYLTLVAGIPTSRRAPKVAGPLHIWKRASPPGHSSPVFSAEHLFLTALDGEKLYTYALDRKTGVRNPDEMLAVLAERNGTTTFCLLAQKAKNPVGTGRSSRDNDQSWKLRSEFRAV